MSAMDDQRRRLFHRVLAQRNELRIASTAYLEATGWRPDPLADSVRWLLESAPGRSFGTDQATAFQLAIDGSTAGLDLLTDEEIVAAADLANQRSGSPR